MASKLIAIIRDRARVARSLFFAAMPWGQVVKAITDEFVLARASIVQRVQHSLLFIEWYKQRVQKDS
eukprot:419041-Lingulodinium_polyedra.AAC.1